MELAAHADAVERLLKGRGLDGYEILILHSRDFSIEAKGGKLDAFKCAEPFGVSVRLQRGEGIGFSFSTTMDPHSLTRMIDGAVVAARMQTPDPCNILPPPAASYPELGELCDESLPGIQDQQKIERALELERLVLSRDPRLKRVRKASYHDSLHSFFIRNSHGVEVAHRGSMVSCSVSVVAESDGDAQMGWAFDFSTRFDGIDLERIAERASRKATSLLGGTLIPTMRSPAVFDNQVASGILELVAQSFLAENVQKGKSMFRGREGERIFSELVTVRDNGLLPGGIGTSPCDGEGVPQQETLLVSSGVLQGFLYDSYWGKRMGCASTGNATRGGVKSPPKLGVHNLFIEPGEHGVEELVAGVAQGVLITDVMGMHTANRITGDFSVGASGFYIEGGEIRHPVKGIAVAGNLLDLFAGVDLVGSDLRFYGPVGSPSIRVSELNVSGS
jgi:PmbA protein